MQEKFEGGNDMVDSNSKEQTIFKESAVEGDKKEKEAPKKTEYGLEENLAGALCYVAWAITGIIFLVIEKENQFVRFHAMQSIITSIALFVITIVLSIIPLFGWILSLLLTPVILGIWLFMMWKAYKGERFKLPFAGDFAEKQLKNE